MKYESFVNSSNGRLVISPKTGEVNRVASRYDNDELRNITKFDVAEWEKFYRQILQSQLDILDLGYWALGGEYVAPEADFRKDWFSKTQVETAKRYVEFYLQPVVLETAMGQRVSYDNPLGEGFSGVEEGDPDICAWGVYGRDPKGFSEHLSDHWTKDDAQFHLDRWKTLI